ncbi:MAG: HAMP domain-containing histidine kinase [Anaerolineae bacterium]|nr:HAMP domain-containing histidine kinase [Gloeobacterales cyanobacterium ES-bin-313]
MKQLPSLTKKAHDNDEYFLQNQDCAKSEPMKDEEKTKDQLIEELRGLRQHLAAMEFGAQEHLQQMQDLERLNQLKDDFLDTVSHELRTPLANMTMAIQLLKNASENRKADYLGILERECLRESRLIKDLLELQELASRPRQRMCEVIDLGEWLHHRIEPFRHQAEKFQQELTLHVQVPIPKLTIDSRSLDRVVTELVDNACKHTVACGHIAVEAESSETDAQSVLVTISNTVEIPMGEQVRIFDKFYRIPSSDAWSRGGTGLGLALVKRVVVERLGGEITVFSQQGWTTFELKLPVSFTL